MLYEKTAYLDDFPINIRIVRVEEYPIHYHQDVEFVYVLKGEIKLRNGYCNYLLKEGDIFTNSGHEVHGLTATDKENIVAIIQVSNRFFTQYFPAMHKGCYFTYANRDLYLQLDALRKMLLQILLNYSQKSFHYKYQCTYMMIDVIKYLNENFNLFTFEDQVIVNFKSDNPVIIERISRIINYIYENHADKITLEKLSEIEHLSTDYISHLIKDYVGITFRELLSLARVELSEISLLETTKTISAIGRDAGFSTTYYYEKFFQKWFGHSPQVHRQDNLPLVLSELRPAKIQLLSDNDAVNITERCLSAVSGQENNASTVNHMQLNVQINPAGPSIMSIDHKLDVVITPEDFQFMGDMLSPILRELKPTKITLAVKDTDPSSKLCRQKSVLEKYCDTVDILVRNKLEFDSAYGYDSIAAYIHIFKKYFLSKEDFVQCKLRDQGDIETFLKGSPSCLTSGLIRKPSFYAYQQLSSVKGDLISWSKYHSAVKIARQEGSTYILTAFNYNDEMEYLCQRNATIHETNQIISAFVDELSLDFSLCLPPGKYAVIRFSLTNENSVFNYMAQLDFPEKSPLPDHWNQLLCTQPYTYTHMEQVETSLNLNFTLQGAGVQVAVVQPL